MNFTVSPAATADVIAASAAYDRKPSLYGRAFENEVDVAFARIAESPRLYSPVEDGISGREIREYFIERFKQRVIYLMTGDDVLVVAVVHASRRERAWHGNVPTDPPPEAS
jgi:plasmid stabilization system protein ParE